ncbi:MAG: TetR family transcriptional regulator [Pseudonocardiales bacterium]|nr:TetR family transcriptional regulator [Pseudonocardiales bacterium]
MSAAVIAYTPPMARWEPKAAERLQKAALELFVERGFERTSAAEIAAAAGLTERTFFRHFRDKRDVLFYGQDAFTEVFLQGMQAAPADASPMQLIAAALHSAASWFPDERRPHSRSRQAVINSDPALQERERHKLAGLATSISAALRERGTAEPAATLAAESGATVFGVAFEQWIRDGEQRSLAVIAEDTLTQLRALNA